MNLEEATRIVHQQQTSYIRGEMSQERIDEISSLYPKAIPDWNRLKLNLKIQKKKLARLYKDACTATYSFRTKELKRMEKIHKQFYKKGIHTLLTWTEFVEEIRVSYSF